MARYLLNCNNRKLIKNPFIIVCFFLGYKYIIIKIRLNSHLDCPFCLFIWISFHFTFIVFTASCVGVWMSSKCGEKKGIMVFGSYKNCNLSLISRFDNWLFVGFLKLYQIRFSYTGVHSNKIHFTDNRLLL